MTKNMKLVFSRNSSWESKIIRWLTWSEWSHVGILLPNRNASHVIESVLHNGVILRPFNESIKDCEYEIVSIPVDNPLAGHVWAKSQLGKPYDVTGIFGFICRKNWQIDNAWFCSELVAYALEVAGTPITKDSVSRITPQDIYKFPEASVDIMIYPNNS